MFLANWLCPNTSDLFNLISCRKTKHYLYDIAVNPGVLEECLKESDMEQMLTTMCLDYVEIEVKIKINRKSCKKVQLLEYVYTIEPGSCDPFISPS